MPSQKSTSFVDYVINTISKENNKGFSAKLKKAENETTEYQSWEILARWVDLEYEKNRRAYALIGASLARAKPKKDGESSLGGALFTLFNQGGSSNDIESSPAALRLRRLLACRDALELIDVLRQVMRLLESKDIGFSRAQLLDDILWFDTEQSRERSRTRWANDFYRKQEVV